jgi:hypothetical protein
MAKKQQILPPQADTPKSTTPPQLPRAPLPSKTWSGAKLRANVHSLAARGYYTLKGQFIVLAVLLFLSSLGMMLVAQQHLQQTHDAFYTIVVKSVPNVDAAQRLLQYVEDVDAKSADYIAAATLTDTHPCQIIGTTRVEPKPLTYHDCDALNIDAELTLANKELYKDIRNATYPGEHTALNRILAGLDEYKSDVMISRHEFEMAGTNFAPTNKHLINAKNAYYAATNVINVQIMSKPVPDASDETNIPPCMVNVRTSTGISTRILSAQEWPKGGLEQNIACLTSINKQHLNDAYKQTEETLGYTLLLLSILSVIFCSLLIYTVWRITLLMHYVIHFTLGLVTLASIIFSVLVVANYANFYGQQGTFKVMVENAYNNVYTSEIILQYATAANADESRWLIAVTFNDRDQIDRWQQDWYHNRDKTTSLIQQAQANRTWPEENKPVADMQSHWKKYTDIDPQIRALATNTTKTPSLYQRILNAQAVSLGPSNGEFFPFSDAVASLSQVNESNLQRIYNQSDGFLTTYIPLCFVLFPLVGVLADWSVLRRTKDL